MIDEEKYILGVDPYESPITSDPFYPPVIDNYQSENEAKIYLTREDINELGFLRSNPDMPIYRHTEKSDLYLTELFNRDYSVKDFIIRTIRVWVNSNTQLTELYLSNKPNKEDIQLIVNSYAV